MSDRRLSILTYHRVLKEPDPMRCGDVDASTFDLHMGLLARFFCVLPLGEAVERLAKRSLPRRAACVTFDDGYADNYDVALPILERWGLVATFFVASGFIEGGRMWNDTVVEALRQANAPMLDLSGIGLGVYATDTVARRYGSAMSIIYALRCLPPGERQRKVDGLEDMVGVKLSDRFMMNREQVRLLSERNMVIGGHTVNHPVLASVDEATARTEIAEGKEHLEAITGRPVRLFAYPNGRPDRDYKWQHVRMVREAGFDAAVTTQRGVARREHDRFQLPRFAPWDRRPGRFLFRFFQNSLTVSQRVVEAAE